MLLPPTFGLHMTQAADFTVLSVEVWSTCLVVNIHVESSAGAAVPAITVEDHWGTVYTLQYSASVGSRNLQVFTPSVAAGTRSLTIRSTDAPEARLVVAFAVRAMPDADGHGRASAYQPPHLRRPA
ncbi:MAG: hypothetical protein NVSMB43_19800 [Pseudarthrobacter sp.]